MDDAEGNILCFERVYIINKYLKMEGRLQDVKHPFWLKVTIGLINFLNLSRAAHKMNLQLYNPRIVNIKPAAYC